MTLLTPRRVSQNGWPAHRDSEGLVPLSWITGRVLPGDVYTVFDYLCRRFNDEVEHITQAHSWGWAYRAVRNGVDLSNHASATAVDLNAPRHVLGHRDTFTAGQVAAIRRILADLGGVVRWGGDYAGRADEMHFEINTSAERVAAVAARLRGGSAAARPTTTTSQEDEMYFIRVTDGQGKGDVYEVGEFTVDKLSAQQFEDIKAYALPRMIDGTEAGVTRLGNRRKARRTHIWGADKGGK